MASSRMVSKMSVSVFNFVKGASEIDGPPVPIRQEDETMKPILIRSEMPFE
jgi:hypothetical protein